jgi:hypothetical protein
LITNHQEDSLESYGRCKASTCLRAKIKQCNEHRYRNKHRYHRYLLTWPRYLKIQRNCRHSLMQPSLQQSLQLSRLYLLLLLYQELSQGQPSSQSILLELAILHGTSRLARD